jgi:tetratricopeptide (TPR) repeat protein
MRLERRFVVAVLPALMVALSLLLWSAQPTHAANDSDDHPTRWRSLALTRALVAADQIEDPYRRAEVLAAIARAQVSVEGATAGDKAIHQALAAASRIDAAEFRGWVLNDIVLAQIAAEDLIGAQQTADSITAVRPQSSALAAIADFRIRSDAIPAAQALALRIREPGTRSDVLRQIVAALCGKGEIQAAMQLLPEIDDKYFSAIAQGDVAVALVRKGDITGAHAAAARARRANRDEAYARIALARSELNDVPGAVQSLEKISDPMSRAIAQGRVALQRVNENDLAVARELLASAMTAVQQAKVKPALKLLPMAQLARWQALAGDQGAARDTLRRLRIEVEQQPAGPSRNELLEYIARSQARAGDVRDAIDAAKNIDDRFERALLVRDSVSLQSDATSTSAAAWAREFNDPLVTTAAQFGVLSLQSFRVGQPLSIETIDAARAAVQSIADVDVKPAAFAALAAARMKAGDVSGSQVIFTEALNAADALPRPELQAAAHVRIVNALNDRLMFLGRAAGEQSATDN